MTRRSLASGDPTGPVDEARVDLSRARARAMLFGSSFFFGLAAMLTRLAALRGMNGGQATLCRFLIGIVVVTGLFQVRQGTFRPQRKGLLVTRGLFGGFAALLYFLAIARIPAGEATLINNTFPIWAVVFSFLLFKERPTLHLGLALAIAGAGVFLVLGGGSAAFRFGRGEGYAVLSAIAGGVAVTSIRTLRATDNTPTIFFAFAVGGLVVSIPFALTAWPSGGLPYLAAVGVGAAAFAAQFFMTEAYGALTVSEAALWQQLTPIASYLWSLLLGERVGGSTMVGVLLGVAGITYGTVFGHRPREIKPVEG